MILPDRNRLLYHDTARDCMILLYGTEDCPIHSLSVLPYYCNRDTLFLLHWMAYRLVALISPSSMEHFWCVMSVKIPPLFLLNSFSASVSRILMETRMVDRDKNMWLFQGSIMSIIMIWELLLVGNGNKQWMLMPWRETYHDGIPITTKQNGDHVDTQ